MHDVTSLRPLPQGYSLSVAIHILWSCMKSYCGLISSEEAYTNIYIQVISSNADLAYNVSLHVEGFMAWSVVVQLKVSSM